VAIGREKIVDLDATPYYHVVSRCVRRAFLCGDDKYTGKNYDYRRAEIEQRILNFSQVFCIDICAYAVMNNHYHVVLKINREQALQLSMDEVIVRYLQVFKGHVLVSRYLAKDKMTQPEKDAVADLVEGWRKRLYSMSWFMGKINEGIARKANKEDKVTGRFWEGRYKCQALLDESALIACMAYVDLNPVRAKIAYSLKDSDYTSIQKRINKLINPHKRTNKKQPSDSTIESSLHAHPETKPEPTQLDFVIMPKHFDPNQPPQLSPFAGNERKVTNEVAQNDVHPDGIPFHLKDYLELVDWTGRVLREDKRGAIAQDVPPILQQLNINPKIWLVQTKHFGSLYSRFAGTAESLKTKVDRKMGRWFKGGRLEELVARESERKSTALA
jgi:REP element-mobilizing transposase RayT